MLLIGSRALLFRAPNLLSKPPLDFDFIGNQGEILSWIKDQNLGTHENIDNKIIVRASPPCEFEITEPGKSAELLIDLVKSDTKTIKTEFGLIPNLNLLFTLKASHKFLKNSPHFWKTAIDYHKMKMFGCKILPEYEEFFKLREKETYTYAHPKLNVTKNSFFNGDQVTYKYDHDSIHEAVKQGEQPAYKYYQKEGSEVQCDKEKFFAVDESIRFNGIIEEACVLALERSLIPFPNKNTPKQAWMMALSKVCSSITSGYFREWGYNHIFEIVKKYPENYYQTFLNGIKTGTVKEL